MGTVIGAIQGAAGAVAQGGDASDIFLSSALGAGEGAVMRLIDPTEGLLTYAIASGVVGTTSNLTGQMISNAKKPPCERNLNYGSLIGAGIGSFLGGGVGGIAQVGLLQYGASEGVAALGGALGAGPSVFGSSTGYYLGK